MNYKVTFYNDLVELLTERKSNFVHKLKGLTTKIINELTNEISKKYNFRGTTGEKLVQFLLSMTKDKNKSSNSIHFYLPINGEEIPVDFYFMCRRTDLDVFFIRTNGACRTINHPFRGPELYFISFNVNFALNEKTAKNTKEIQKKIIDDIHHTVVHELAHAYDEHLFDEMNDNKKEAKSSNKSLEYLKYWLKPTEIRSHLNGVFKALASYRHETPKRVIKNFYKNADKASNLEQDPIPFTQDKKDTLRKNYANMVELDNSKQSYELSIKGLNEIISKSFRNRLPKSLRQFIIDYEIAFSRDFSSKMKERYYDKLFQGYEVPSLEQMNTMFEAIKTVYRGTLRIYNAIKKKYYFKNSKTNDLWVKIESLFNIWEDSIWDNSMMEAAMKANDPKKLKAAAKKIFDSFKTQMGVE